MNYLVRKRSTLHLDAGRPHTTQPTERGIHMPILTRFTIDLVTEEELSDRRVQSIAEELTDNLHVLVVEADDECHEQVNKYAVGHVHDTNDGDRCPDCVNQSLDYRNGQALVDGDF